MSDLQTTQGTIFDYILSEENRYVTIPIPVVDNYEWHMARHVKLTTLYINSQFETGNKDMKPFKNIVLPAINTQHRSVQFSLKEINFFIDDKDEFYKSYLVRKYHERWARIHALATFLDDMTEQYTDYGGTLIKKTKDSVPSVIPFQQLAFCDQTDILTGPICEKHQYSPAELKDMEQFKWGDKAYGATITIDELITLAQNQKTSTQVSKGKRKIQTPSKYVEVYELHGVLPAKFLLDPEVDDVKETDYIRQMHIIAYYTDLNGHKQGVTLFKGKEKEQIYKFFKRDPIYGRALGRGGVEELFDAQVWANYSQIQQKELLDVASKVFYKTTDKNFASRNRVDQAENQQVFTLDEGKDINQMNNSPVNLPLFTNSIAEWTAQAEKIASTFNPFQNVNGGKLSFKLGAMIKKDVDSIHEYRKGKIGGQFLPEVYKDWILPQIAKDLTNGKIFSSMCSLDEMEKIAEDMFTNQVNEYVAERLFNMTPTTQAEIDTMKAKYKAQFFKTGSQKFFELLKEELQDLPIEMTVDITQEEMMGAAVAEQLSGVFSQLVPVLGANPQFFEQNPMMAKIFKDILESSGLNPMDYDTSGEKPMPVQNRDVTSTTVPAGGGQNTAVATA